MGHKKDDSSYYLDMFPQWDFIPVESHYEINATDCRNAYYRNGVDNQEVKNLLFEYTTLGVLKELEDIPIQQYTKLKERYEFCEKYKEEWGEGPFYTSDAVVVKSGHVLLITRGGEPDKGKWAFPGGFVNKDENFKTAAQRELAEETGLHIDLWEFDKFGVYNKSGRDDRGNVISSAFIIDSGTGKLPEVKGADDAVKAEWVPIADLRANNMAFDHYFILRDLMRKL